MRITLSNRLALAAVAPLLMAGLVACGGDDGDAAETSSSSTSEASEATEEAPADDSAAGDEIDPAEFAQRLITAAKNTKTAHTEMEIGTGDQSITAEGDVDYQSDPLSMRLVMSIPTMGDGIEMLIVDGAMYMKMPGLSDGKYIKTDMDDPTNPMSQMTDQLDPMAQFEAFEDAVTSVTFVGDEDVDGETLARYTLLLDSSKLPNQQGTTMPDEVEYDVWLDGDDRPRKMAFDMSGTTLDMTISDFDKKVTIKAPKDNQIMEMPTP